MATIIISLPFTSYSQNTFKTQINQPNAPVTIDARNASTNYIQVINGIALFSDEYKSLSLKKVNDTLSKYKCNCFSMYRIIGISKDEVVEDVRLYFVNAGADITSVSGAGGHEPSTGIDVIYDPSGNATTGGGCVYLYVGRVFDNSTKIKY